MGKILDTALALIFVAVVVGLFANSVLFNASTDANKKVISVYNENNTDSNTTKTLLQQNSSYHDSGDVAENMKAMATALQTTYANSQKGLTSGNPIEILGAAFGLVSSLALNSVFLLFVVILQGINMTVALASNMMSFPGAWESVGIIGTLAIALMTVYLTVKIIASAAGRDI